LFEARFSCGGTRSLATNLKLTGGEPGEQNGAARIACEFSWSGRRGGPAGLWNLADAPPRGK